MCIVFLDEYKSHVSRFADEHKLDGCLIGLFLHFMMSVAQASFKFVSETVFLKLLLILDIYYLSVFAYISWSHSRIDCC